MNPRLILAAALVAAGCASQTNLKYCEDMKKTGKEIEALETLNGEYRKNMDQVPPGTDSTEYLKYAIQQQIDENNEKIRYLKEYNQTNAANCAPGAKGPEAVASPDYR